MNVEQNKRVHGRDTVCVNTIHMKLFELMSSIACHCTTGSNIRPKPKDGLSPSSMKDGWPSVKNNDQYSTVTQKNADFDEAFIANIGTSKCN